MRKFTLFLIFFAVLSLGGFAQGGHDIKINFKGCTDSTAYLVLYRWDQQYLIDTCKNVKNGQIQFKGKRELDKGVYVLVSQRMAIYFDFIINESQKFTINADIADISESLKAPGNKENELFFSYVRFLTGKNKEFGKIAAQTKGKSKEDSTKFMNEKIAAFMKEAKQFDKDFIQKNKGTFVGDLVNLKTDKEPEVIPKASNGRPDSIYAYFYRKAHYFDGVDFKDERMIRNQFFDDRIKGYFDNVIIQHPDTVIEALDMVLSRCGGENLIYNILLGHFTYKYEQNKNMLFDKDGNTSTFEKVFIHLSQKYILSGKAKGVYTEETNKKIKERIDILVNLQPGATVANLYMIDTTGAKSVSKMGFDTCKTSLSLSTLFYAKEPELKKLYKTLYDVKAKYTVLVFWASDCGHCQTDIPKLSDSLRKLKGKVDFKVFGVQTKDDLEPWRKFIIEKKLDFIDVYDPMHYNNLKERFDINSTPVIYILDRDKRIKAKKLSVEQVIELLELFEKIEQEKNKK